MKLPIILSENGDIMMFSSKEEACSYLEPIDIRNDEYLAYDAEGTPLNLGISNEEKSLFRVMKYRVPKVTIEEVQSRPSSSELRQKLLDYSHAVGVTIHDNDISLSDLISMLKKYASNSN